MHTRVLLLLLLVLALAGALAWRVGINSDSIEPEAPTSDAPIDSTAHDVTLEAPAMPSNDSRRVNEATPATAVANARAKLIIHCIDQTTREALNDMQVEVKPRQAATPLPGIATRLTDVSYLGSCEIEVPSDVDLDVLGRMVRGEHIDAVAFVEKLEAGERRAVVLEFAMEPKTIMHVRLVDQEAGLGVARAHIERAYDERPNLESGPGGRFVLSFAPPTRLSTSTERNGLVPRAFCRVRAEGYGLAEFRSSEGHEREDIALDVQLTREATLTVTLSNRKDQHARAYEMVVTVNLADLVQNNSSQSLVYDKGTMLLGAPCDIAGTMHLAGLPANVPLSFALFRASEPLRAHDATLKFKPGEERALQIDLGAACHVRGRLIDTRGVPVPDLQVWITPDEGFYRAQFAAADGNHCVARGRSDSAGNFDLGQIAVGHFLVGLAPIPYSQKDKEESLGQSAMNLAVEIAEGETAEELELRVCRGLFIRGSVRKPDGSAMNGSRARISASSPERHAAVTTSLFDGDFILGPLVEARYTLVAEGNNDLASSLPVEAAAGTTDVVLTMRAGASLSGHVVERAGGPGVRAMILNHAEGAHVITSRQSTDDQGNFRYAMLNPGRMSLTAHTSDGRVGVFPALNLAAGEDRRDVEVLLSPGAKLRIRSTTDARITGIAVFQDGALVAFPAMDDPGAAGLSVPSGELTVRVGMEGKTCEKTLRVSAGEGREVEFP
ncbi:MAG TPA: hypothetical protein VK843_03255 [Planctomycetota bacterium]|nr:hypothetical protein [Planctomycetota bacterium]